MLDIAYAVRVDVKAFVAEQHDMGVCDAIEKRERGREPRLMSTPHVPKVAGFSPTLSPPQQTAPVDQLAAVQDRLAGWISDLTTLHELTERLARTRALDPALHELLTAGAALVGARRGLVSLAPVEECGPEHTVGLGLGRADLGHLETVPRHSASCARLLDGEEGTRSGSPPGVTAGAALPAIVHTDIAADDTLDPLHREVASRLGYAASYAVPLTTHTGRRIGAAVWLYDEPAEPSPRQRHLLGLYTRCATEHLDRRLELARARRDVAAVREELLPGRLPRLPGVHLAVRHRTGPRGGGDWYDALPLPEGALGLAVGGVTGGGASTMAVMGRMRASLRAYAVMEGEDPVAVLSDLELLLRLTEPARSATALFAYAEPAARRVVLAGAGHCPPLIAGPARTEFAETALSAPLGMLACWEAPSAELLLGPGETLLLYSDGLLRRTGEGTDRAYQQLHQAVATARPEVRDDPDALVDHVLQTLLPDGRDTADHPEDVVLLAARFG
ncbi:PP2C family protein-serine/threonine phosphatase [Streptomyces sp. JJ36]|uniref:PP2C family protein-serine/threonine phosphatase n=1 Tax=Streptomyces sp. JJ36 TaxID=2736645 RepID=UPI001F30BAE3|nr:PP2C family protein-serine/threonine phosphatase [Streptomyces sp. JJ36]MCF6522115.1 serine/threonine-protein phosphatase [Streptomyces sp. JJ36]